MLIFIHGHVIAVLAMDLEDDLPSERRYLLQSMALGAFPFPWGPTLSATAPASTGGALQSQYAKNSIAFSKIVDTVDIKLHSLIVSQNSAVVVRTACTPVKDHKQWADGIVHCSKSMAVCARL